ncbi:MAG: ATP-binding protein, partial [Acidobacteriota bacterium]
MDVQTLLVVLAIIVALGGGAIVLLWWRNREERGLGTLSLACLCGAASGLLAGTYGRWPEVASILIPDLLTTLSFAGFLEGLRRFSGLRPRSIWPLALAGAHGVLSATWTWLAPDPGARAILTTSLMVVLCTTGVAVVARGATSATRFGSGLLTTAVGGFAALAAYHLLSLVRVRPVGLSVSAVFAVGMIVFMLFFLSGLFMTISERHADRLQQLRAQAEAGERAKAGFLAVMSHEIRTPMNGVLGLSELLLSSGVSERQRQLAVSIRSSGRILLRILDDVLDLSKIEAGRLKIEVSTFSLRDLVEEVRQLVRGAAARKGLTLGTDVGADVPATVAGDPERIGQVLLNLMGNAVKFTEGGSVVLRVTAAEDGFLFTVTDTGIGIEAEHLDLLFQPYQQVGRGDGRRIGGTGLGLAISKLLVHLMGGRVSVESTPGRGSRFSVLLPLEASEEAPETDEILLRQVFFDEILPASTAAASTDPSSVHILVAEDDPVSQVVAEGMLSGLGVACTVVPDGEAAVAALASRRFDLVFMDCHMPRLDGFEATARVRAAEATAGGPRTPIIALTAGVMGEERERCYVVGMDDVIAKPVSTE